MIKVKLTQQTNSLFLYFCKLEIHDIFIACNFLNASFRNNEFRVSENFFNILLVYITISLPYLSI